MKKTLFLLSAVVIGLTACNNFQKGNGGLEYKIFKNAGKTKIKVGDFVELNGVIKTQKDSILNSTYEVEQPAIFEVPKSMYAGDLGQALTLLGEGDSAQFRMNMDSLKKYNPGQKFDSTQKYMVYTIKIEKVLSKGANESDSIFNTKKQAFYMAEMKTVGEKLEKAEAPKIEKYIKDNDLKVSTTPEGLYYKIDAAGTPERPVAGDTVTIKYTGSFTKKDDKGKYKIFDTTDPIKAKESGNFNPMKKYEAVKLVVGQVIPGFSNGLTMIGKGGKISLIIPSKLGYGAQGMPPVIAPYSPIVFDVELIDFKKGVAPKAMVPPPAPVAAAPVKK